MADLKPPALDPKTLPARTGSGYPEPFQAAVAAREKRALGDALGLKNFGVNFTRLPPGNASSQRHCHTKQDEFVFIIEGEVVLVTDAGEQVLSAGMVAGFPAGTGDGHHLINRSDRRVHYLEISNRIEGDDTFYPDDDMLWIYTEAGWHAAHTDGRRYEGAQSQPGTGILPGS